MKKIITLLLSAVMVLSLVACGGKDTDKTDLDYVKDNGKLIVGITEYAPMDYKDEDGNWIGFDAEMATAFAEYLGVEVEFFVSIKENSLLTFMMLWFSLPIQWQKWQLLNYVVTMSMPNSQ